MAKTWRTSWLGALLLVALTVSPAGAVIIIAKSDPDRPIKGFLIRESESGVEFDELLPGGELRRRALPRAAIELVLYAFSAERLQSLDPKKPQDYRIYAEELAEKPDPEARALAIRLYLIAAYLDPPGLGRGCLLAMSPLAAAPHEERKYRAMAYLLDPAHDRGALRPPSVVSLDAAGLTDLQRKALATGLRALRSGDKSLAQQTSQQPPFRIALEQFESLLSLDEFVAAARDPRELLSPGLLKRIVQLELALSPAPGARRADEGGRPLSWSELVAQGRDRRATPLTLEALTPYDPRQSVYRDGKWVEP